MPITKTSIAAGSDGETDRGAALRSRRHAAGLSVERLAGLADCSPASIERIERGYRPKRSRVIPALYAVLDELEAEARA